MLSGRMWFLWYMQEDQLLTCLRCPGHVKRWNCQKKWRWCSLGAEGLSVTGSADLSLLPCPEQRRSDSGCLCSAAGSDLTLVWHLLPPVQPHPGDLYTLLRSSFPVLPVCFSITALRIQANKNACTFVTSPFLSVEFWLHNLNAELKPVWLSVGREFQADEADHFVLWHSSALGMCWALQWPTYSVKSCAPTPALYSHAGVV